MSRPLFRAYPVNGPRTEAGAALLAFLLVLLVGASYALLGDAKSLAQRAKLEESRKTSAALAEAKAALIGYMVSRLLEPECDNPDNDCNRPGDLPCPDRNNDGEYNLAEGTCGTTSVTNIIGTNQAEWRLGRLPWKTLDLPDVRDGSGERLWYAVSANFKTNNRSRCVNPGSFGCLNSDSRGRITVKVPGPDTDSDGDPDDFEVLHDGRNPDWRNPAERVDPAAQWTPSGAVAVVIAPGKPLERQGGIAQYRGGPCETASTTSCAQNYLDVGLGEDNATFYDGPTLSNRGDGFIAGEVVENCDDGACDVIVNDRILPITYQDIIPLLEKRVVRDVLTCLRQYEIMNPGIYPWAANPSDVHDPGPPPDYQHSDETNRRFGRLPDPPFDNTALVSPGNTWPSGCPILYTGPHTGPPRPKPPAGGRPPPTYAQWWFNWKELVFYGLGSGYKPGGVGNCTAGCLAVDPPSSTPDKRVVAIAAGKRLAAVPGGQPRDDVDKATLANYLEDQNATPGDDAFTTKVSGNPPPPFNDVVGYLNVDGDIP